MSNLTRGKLLLVVPVVLLVALVQLDAKWHLAVGVVAWSILRLGAGDLYGSLGRTKRWLQGLIVLSLLGAVFGLTDRHNSSLSWSMSGALAGTTMVVRAYALVAITSLASSVVPFRRLVNRIRSPLIQRILEVVVVAVNLVPVQVRALSIASVTLKERRPGLSRLPERLWLLAVHSSLRSAMLAESVALDIAIAAHNAGGDGKEIL